LNIGIILTLDDIAYRYETAHNGKNRRTGIVVGTLGGEVYLKDPLPCES